MVTKKPNTWELFDQGTKIASHQYNTRAYTRIMKNEQTARIEELERA